MTSQQQLVAGLVVTTLKHVSQHALMLQVTVTACEMLAEAGSGGSLYTAYMVEARSSPLQPSWIVRRRFRSLTLLPTLAVTTIMAVMTV